MVFDAVYTPKVTRLLRDAESSGATVVSGLEMFIRQAMCQFELFTGLAGKIITVFLQNFCTPFLIYIFIALLCSL